MKTKFRRLLAVLLLVCTLISMVVPATFAETSEYPTDPNVFDFCVYNYPGFGITSSMAYSKSNSATRKMMADFYPDKLNWVLETYASGVSDADIDIRTADNQGIRVKMSVGEWVAFRLNVASAGTYTLTMNSPYSLSSSADVFVMPASETTMTDAQVEAAMAAGEPMGAMSMTATELSSEIGEYTFEAGEYVIALKLTSGNRVYLGQLALTEVAGGETTEPTTEPATEATTVPATEPSTEPEEDGPVTYNFVLYNPAQDAGYNTMFLNGGTTPTNRHLDQNCYCGCGKKILAHLNASYAALGWQYVASSYTLANLMFRSDSNWGLRTKGAGGDWVAFKLNVPQADTYSVQFTASAASAAQQKAYIFTPEALEGKQIAQLMNDQTLVGVAETTADVRTDPFGNWEFATAGEYILVLQSVNANNLFIGQITLDAPLEDSGEEPEETTQPEEPEYAEEPNVFDFCVYNYTGYGITGPITYGKNKTRERMASFYPDKLNWVLEETVVPDTDIEIRAANDQGLRVKMEVGQYVAFRINVAQAGTYDLTLSSPYSTAWGADVYLFPGVTETKQAMTQENLLGVAAMTGSALSCRIGEYTFESGEYIIALKLTSGNRLYLGQLSLTVPGVAEIKPAAEEMIYDFDLVAKDKTFLTKAISTRYYLDDPTQTLRIYTVLEQMYGAGQIRWKYENHSEALQMKEGTFREGCFRFKGTQNYNLVNDPWMAFRLENPGMDTYDIRMKTNGDNKICANIYLIPAKSVLGMSAQEIQAAMTKENLLVADAMFDGEGTFYLGEYTFKTPNEHILVLQFTKGTFLYMSQIQMTKDGILADGTVIREKQISGVVYDLDQADRMSGAYNKGTVLLPDVVNDISARYASGNLNWKFHTACAGMMATETVPSETLKFYRARGMRIPGWKEGWAALKIKSPGSGTFTVSVNYATSADSGTMAMYVLPADTPKEELYALTDPTNRIGKVVLTNEAGEATIDDGHTAFVGHWEFEAGKEYIILLEGYENSIFDSTRSYMYLSQIVMQRGKIEYSEEEDKRVTPMTIVDDPIQVADSGLYSAISEVNGHDYYFTGLEGGSFLVYDLQTFELVDEVQCSIKKGHSMAVAPDGKIWYVGESKVVFYYDPYTGAYGETANIANATGLAIGGVESVAVDENGILYFGVWYTANVIRYDPVTKEFTDLGVFAPGARKAYGLTCHNGYLYAALHGEGAVHAIAKYNLTTGQVEKTLDITHLMGEATYTSALSKLGDNLMIAGGSYLGGMIAFDMQTMELVDTGMPAGASLGCTEEIDGKHYVFMQGYGLYEYDVQTGEFSKSPGFGSAGQGFRTGAQNGYGKSIVTVDGERYLFTYTQTGAHPRVFNLETREYLGWDNLVYNVGGGTDLIGFVSGPEGSNELYIGSYNTPFCFTYNTELGKITRYYETGGQTDSQVWYNGKLYAGNYSSTTLNEIELEPVQTDTDAELKNAGLNNTYIQRWRLDHNETGQKRVMALSAGDGYVFAGTIPDSNQHGGSVTVYSTETGRWSSYRNVVQDQSVNGLAYADGLLYGTTTTLGGSGAEIPAGASAKIFVFDYKNMEVLATLDPRDYIKGLASPVTLVRGIAADPNVEENGRIWAIVSETLFCFTYDKENKTFQVQEIAVYDKTAYLTKSNKGWISRPIVFDMEKKQVYAVFDGNGGMRCLELADWNAEIGSVKVAKDERLKVNVPKFFLLGEDGNLYLSNGPDLMMLPLNVTQEQWAVAEKVDAMMLALKENDITLETEAAIKEARSAYENLSWYYKSLIQHEDLLQEAESDLLECKINGISDAEITAEDYPSLQSLMDIYQGLNSRQKRYVKNYEALKAAYDAASDLNDQVLAAAMQARINALQEKFPLALENEPEVLQLRADFDAMTGEQKLLVDTALLEDAEAQIAVLRAEFVKYVETLIQAIPAEITLDADEAITKAREAADKLYANERKEVSYSKLTSAEGKLRTLKNAKAAADEVDTLIDAIGIVTLGDKDRIAVAREACDGLSETALEFVTNGGKLRRAEFILKALQTWGIPVITVANAGIVFAVIWFVPSLHIKIFKTKKKEKIEE